MKRYLINLLIAIDQLGNALFNGAPDETISSRCARGREKWYWAWLARILDWLDPGHCADALNSEENRAHLPEELRK